MTKLHEFTDDEARIVHDTLQERYGQPVATQLADDDRELTQTTLK